MYGMLWVFKLTNWQELIAKEAFPSNFVAFTQEMGCQISAFVPFDERLHCESFFFPLPCTQLPMLELFSFYFLKRKKRTISAYKQKTKSSGSMMQQRPARQ